MKYVILLLIVSLTVHSFPLIKQSSSEISYEYSDLNSLDFYSQDGLNETYFLNTTGELTGSEFLDFGSKFNSRNIIREGELIANFNSIYSDILTYRTNFKTKWENRSSDHITSFDIIGKRAMISAENAPGGLIYDVPFNKSISNNIVLDVSISDFSFELPESVNGYLVVIFEFDTVNVRFVLSTTPALEFLHQNTTNELSIYWENNISPINLSDFFEIEKQPNKINSFKIQSVGNQHNYSVVFDKINVLEEKDTLKLKDNGLNDLARTSIFHLEQDESIEFNIDENTKTNMSWILTYNETEEVIFSLYAVDNLLHGSGILTKQDIYHGYLIHYNFSSIFSELTIHSSQVNSTNQSFYVNNSMEIQISGILRNHFAYNEQQDGIQGKNNLISILSDTYRSVILFHTITENTHRTQLEKNQTHDHISIYIPDFWRKGKVSIFILHETGGYSIMSLILKKSPTTLISPNKYVINPGQQVTFPVVFQNLTSGINHNATRIETKLNDSLRSIDDHFGIRVSADEFVVGKFTLEVNASAPGFVNVEFEMKIIVTEKNYTMESTVRRLSPTSAEIDLRFIGLANISVPAYLEILDGMNDNFAVQGEYSEILITNNDWEEDLNYELKFTLVIGQNISRLGYNIIIPVYDGNNTTPMILSIISFMGIIGTISYKLYNYRYGDKSINF